MDNQSIENKKDKIISAVLSYEEPMRRFALSLTKNEEDAQDLLQETFLKVLQNADTYESSNLKAWVCTIMKNTFINAYRRKQTARLVRDESADFYSLENSVSNPSDAADLHYSVSEIRQKIAEKPEEQRIPFEMMLDGYHYEEIAEKLDAPIGSIKSRIFYIRQKLMKDFSDVSLRTEMRTA